MFKFQYSLNIVKELQRKEDDSSQSADEDTSKNDDITLQE